jgi:hypothetical protein
LLPSDEASWPVETFNGLLRLFAIRNAWDGASELSWLLEVQPSSIESGGHGHVKNRHWHCLLFEFFDGFSKKQDAAIC